MTTRAEQKEQRRQQIMSIGLKLFIKKGYADTKIADIAKEANMSMGLMFHYFESKEQLYRELVMMGAEGTQTPQKMSFQNPIEYFSGFLATLFQYSKEQPWIMSMFVLMSHARSSESVPEDIRTIARNVNQIEVSAQIIAEGQKEGYFKQGDPNQLAFTFWSSVQGVMEELATNPELPFPDPEWLVDIIRGGEEK